MNIARALFTLLARLFGDMLRGSCGPLSETTAFQSNACVEDYLISMSDMDARWYYERKSWGN